MMKKAVAVITSDEFLYQKIYLILQPYADITRDSAHAGICLWDIDSFPAPDDREGVILVGRGSGDLKRPFSHDELIRRISGDGAALTIGDRCAFLRGRHIRLTEVEFSLLSCLVNADGEFVSRDELIGAVWGPDFDGGVLNVYIHYLREKLEFNGEKIIISSRKNGYKIDEKYLKEQSLC